MELQESEIIVLPQQKQVFRQPCVSFHNLEVIFCCVTQARLRVRISFCILTDYTLHWTLYILRFAYVNP